VYILSSISKSSTRDQSNHTPDGSIFDCIQEWFKRTAKGFDYACVFLIGLDSVDETHTTSQQIERLAYVGLTRARYQLYIPYINKTAVIEKLLAAA
jgi:hypothetical protein